MKKLIAQLRQDETGATMLEWTLLVAAIVLPSYVMLRVALEVLVSHYQMIVKLNGLPMP